MILVRMDEIIMTDCLYWDILATDYVALGFPGTPISVMRRHGVFRNMKVGRFSIRRDLEEMILNEKEWHVTDMSWNLRLAAEDTLGKHTVVILRPMPRPWPIERIGR